MRRENTSAACGNPWRASTCFWRAASRPPDQRRRPHPAGGHRPAGGAGGRRRRGGAGQRPGHHRPARPRGRRAMCGPPTGGVPGGSMLRPGVSALCLPAAGPHCGNEYLPRHQRPAASAGKPSGRLSALPGGGRLVPWHPDPHRRDAEHQLPAAYPGDEPLCPGRIPPPYPRGLASGRARRAARPLAESVEPSRIL